jgi:methylenetetrahydrofolate--tRNA-(uracil-5-)-methyltransferase
LLKVRVIGGGLAGSEAALQLASFGFLVELIEMKPHKKTPAQKLDGLCELVCSNSFRSTKHSNAVALLKDEMLLLNGFLMRLALEAQVPAGDALAVDRVIFSRLVEENILANPRITLVREELTTLPLDDIPTIMATGPLTSDALAADLVRIIGQERLDFYDAIAPIIDTESIDMTKAFKQSRWHDEEEEQGDYINCPMDKATYEEFISRLQCSTRAKMHEFENAHFFEGCLPIEVMAERGVETLRFGPFKPVGLHDPHLNERPHAVLQLRKEDKYGTSYNMVGCQTRMTIPEQKETFALIPALKNVKFMRFGAIHRNTYVNGPEVLDEHLRVKDSAGKATNIFLAGQITGVEGYVESMAMGLVVAHIVNSFYKNQPCHWPVESALGALYGHVLGHHRARAKDPYMPSNITWAMVPPVVAKKSLGRAHKREMLYERGIAAIKEFKNRQTLLEGPQPVELSESISC